MPVVNGVVRAPYGPADIYRLLGVSRREDGYNVGYIVSDKEGRVNKWAKYKPISINKITISEQDLSEKDYGLNVSGNNNPLEIYDSGYSGYSYIPPGKTFPKRLRDFEGYSHKVYPPLISNAVYNRDEEVNLAINSFASFYVYTNDDALCVPINKMKTLENTKFCVLLFKDSISTNIFHRLISPENINEIGVSLSYQFSASDQNNTFVALYCLYEEGSDLYYPIPYSNESYYSKTIKVVNINKVVITAVSAAIKGYLGWTDITPYTDIFENSYLKTYGQDFIDLEFIIDNERGNTPLSFGNGSGYLKVVARDTSSPIDGVVLDINGNMTAGIKIVGVGAIEAIYVRFYNLLKYEKYMSTLQFGYRNSYGVIVWAGGTPLKVDNQLL